MDWCALQWWLREGLDSRIWIAGYTLALTSLRTILIGASNYNMQRFTSPTRREVDSIHSKGLWLDVGVPPIELLSREDAGNMKLAGCSDGDCTCWESDLARSELGPGHCLPDSCFRRDCQWPRKIFGCQVQGYNIVWYQASIPSSTQSN